MLTLVWSPLDPFTPYIFGICYDLQPTFSTGTGILHKMSPLIHQAPSSKALGRKPLFSRIHYSPKFRGIADEMDRDHSVDPIVNGISAREWKARKEVQVLEDETAATQASGCLPTLSLGEPAMIYPNALRPALKDLQVPAIKAGKTAPITSDTRCIERSSAKEKTRRPSATSTKQKKLVDIRTRRSARLASLKNSQEAR